MTKAKARFWIIGVFLAFLVGFFMVLVFRPPVEGVYCGTGDSKPEVIVLLDDGHMYVVVPDGAERRLVGGFAYDRLDRQCVDIRVPSSIDTNDAESVVRYRLGIGGLVLVKQEEEGWTNMPRVWLKSLGHWFSLD